jgi:putative CocE/NonD family hydrolase
MKTVNSSLQNSKKVDFHWGIKIPLRDGIHLSATVYVPKGQASPAACVITLTPYISDTYHERAVYFATNGLPFLIVDVRGRGNSEGQFRPFIQEAKDGYDVVEWIAHQPYCSGKVAMWGGSYAGYNQWAAAKEFPPHLATIVPVAAPFAGADFPMRNNIRCPYLMQWITHTSGHASHENMFRDAAFWSAIYRQWYESGRPFCEVDSAIGNPSPVFQEWLEHPEPDEYWDAYNPTAQEYARLQIPILTITGSYDDDQPGALAHYQEHLRNAPPEARELHYLIIGPWDHAGTRTPKRNVGGLELGPASLLDLPKLHREWYAWTMQDGPKPEFLREPVTYYVMGLERWRYAETLEGITARHEPYYLDSAGNADDVYSSGSLGPILGTGSPDTYRFDPGDTHGPEIDAESRADGASLVDQSVILALRGKALIYHGAPFQEDTEISGFFRFSAWISIDCPDTDLYVSVYEISLDGGSLRLSTDAIRARYREGLRTVKLVRTCAPACYEFNRFTFVSRQIRRGHRLRLVIAPMGRIFDTTFAERNYNSGGVVAEESILDARTVTVRLFHDADHPSALYLPIGQGQSSEEPTAPPSSFILTPR